MLQELRQLLHDHEKLLAFLGSKQLDMQAQINMLQQALINNKGPRDFMIRPSLRDYEYLAKRIKRIEHNLGIDPRRPD